MKFKVKINQKSNLKTVILVILLTLSMASLINTNSNISIVNQEVETLNTSAEASMPVTPKYEYAYENDFDYHSHYTKSPEAHSEGSSLSGNDTEWSQDSTDAETLQLYYTCAFEPLGGLYDFTMNQCMQVISHNTFKKQSDLNLGAYIDWKIDVDNPNVFPDSLDIDNILISLSILKPNIFEELITIENLNPQEGTFYLANFDQYIWADGRIRFALRGLVYGNIIVWSGIGISIKFEGLKVVQEIKPVKSEAEKRTLILVHGFSFTKTYSLIWATYLNSLEFRKVYDKFIVISYLGDYCAYRFSKNESGVWQADPTYDLDVLNTSVYTSIKEIATGLALYIMQDLYYIGDNVDIVCHSMGGLVTRNMVKRYYSAIQALYESLGRKFKIHNVCTIATPNHGLWYGWITALFPPPLPPPTQVAQMAPGSPFLTELNYIGVYPGTEIPLSGIFINWFTYRSGYYETLDFIRHDGVVEMISVPIIGATNKGIYDLNHGALISSKMMNHVVFNDIFKPPELIQTIFNEGTPGKIIKIEDLTLQPNYEESGGKTLLSITLPAEDAIDIDSTAVTLNVSTYNYHMTLKAGTTDTYEVELPLADGNYSFLITADKLMLDGWLYQMSGNLIIIDDDVKPPVIQITPKILSISDEDAVGGVSIAWEISDYSGILEAKVLLNGIEIRSYTNQGTITDSYLLPNELGVYTISIWARDNDADPEHDPPGEDWSEYSIERIITIYDDDLNPPEIQITPGDLTISVEEAEGGVLISWEISDYSGISEANMLLNGIEIRSYANQGTIIDSYLLANEPGIYNFTIWAKDNDNDLEDDWLENSTKITITIYEVDDLPPPAIPGYSVFVLLGILSVVIILISKKRRNYKI